MASAPTYCTHKELKRVFPQLDEFDQKKPVYGWVEVTTNKYAAHDSGAIDIQGCPPNAQFVVDANYGSAHSGGNNYTSNQQNSLLAISGRSCNSKINTVFEVIGLK